MAYARLIRGSVQKSFLLETLCHSCMTVYSLANLPICLGASGRWATAKGLSRHRQCATRVTCGPLSFGEVDIPLRAALSVPSPSDVRSSLQVRQLAARPVPAALPGRGEAWRSQAKWAQSQLSGFFSPPIRKLLQLPAQERSVPRWSGGAGLPHQVCLRQAQ